MLEQYYKTWEVENAVITAFRILKPSLIKCNDPEVFDKLLMVLTDYIQNTCEVMEADL